MIQGQEHQMALLRRLSARFVDEFPDDAVPSAGPRSAGDLLRQQREALGLDLRDVADALKIKPNYLAALEAGRPDLLPGPTYAIGFVRAYAEHLHLDGNEMLRRFKAESAALDAKPDLAFPMPLGERSMPGGSTLLVALILALCGYGTWYYLATGERSHPERVTEVPDVLLPPAVESTPPSAAEVAPPNRPADSAEASPSPFPSPGSERGRAAGSPDAVAPTSTVSPPALQTATLTASAAAATVLAEPTPAPQGDEPHAYGAVDGPARVVIRATADSWVQIRDTGQSTLFTRVLKAGESYRVADRPGLSLRTGNAGGLEITVDGQPAPSLGPNGAVRNVPLEPQSLISGMTKRE
jgi:cytoskeleton protein RodZ